MLVQKGEVLHPQKHGYVPSKTAFSLEVFVFRKADIPAREGEDETGPYFGPAFALLCTPASAGWIS